MTRYCILLLAALILTGCSGDDEEQQSGAIDQLTDKVAQKAVQNIREPIERAKQAQAIQEAHTKAINEAVENM